MTDGQPATPDAVRALIMSKGKAEQQKGLLLVRQLPAALALELLLLSLDTSQNEFIRATAAVGLGQLEQPDNATRNTAIHAMIRLLNNDKEYSVRSSAAAGMGYLTNLPQDVLSTVIDALSRGIFEDTEWQVQFSCLAAIGNLKDVRAVPVILPCLRSNNDLLVQAAVGALGEIGDSSVIPELLKLLGCEDMMTRQRLAQALGLMEDCRNEPAVIDALRTLSRDQSFAVRDAANEGLQQFGYSDPAKQGDLSDAELIDREVENLLSGDESGEAGESAGDALRRRLERSFDKECVDGHSKLDAGGSRSNPNDVVKNSAASGSGQGSNQTPIVSDEEYLSLINDLKHGSHTQQSVAAIRLRKCDGPRALQAVIAANALDPSVYSLRVRSLAVSLLARARAMDKILHVLRTDPEENVRSACCDAATDAGGGKEAVEACIEAFEKDPKWLVRVSAAIALGSIGKESAQAEDSLIHSLQPGGVTDLGPPQDSVIRRHAVTALGFIGSQKCVPTLKRLVDDPDTDQAVRFRIAAALRGIHSKESADLARTLVSDSSDEVSEMAQGSLDALTLLGFA